MSNHPPRRRPRRGRHLGFMSVAEIINDNPRLRRLDDMLCADGFKRQSTTRPYLARNGLVTLRLVWRCRRDGRCAKHEEIYRISLLGLALEPPTEEAAE